MAGRPSGAKTRCSGKWTEAKFRSFVKGNLRRATMKWSPINEVKTEARTRRGYYKCAGCQEEVPASTKRGRSREKNIHVDHIVPVISPEVGWVSWDETIDRLFSEKDNLQVLCTDCHTKKTNEEKQLAKDRRDKEKLNDK